ncbi:MAG TPA: metalloregulator ArsR/SmtB family transcription factor [Kofleriaceae bacterium]|nr:metalloregulator ArsR/SmtB family transcription factor [Kofleriaceae bacterium]
MRSTSERLDHLFGALSDHTRRQIVARLSRAPATIGELAEPFAMSLPAVSKHVRVLERAGLVRRTIDGRVHHCALDRKRLRDASRWITRYTEFWTQTLDSLADFVEDKT